MKKNYLLILLAMAAFASCKKDGGTTATISPSDSSAISAALSVWHGTNTKGTAPALNPGGGLSIGGDTSELVSYSGGYLVLHPNVQGGNIQGYYIHVNGADNYFTVNFNNGIGHRPTIAQRPVAGLGATHHLLKGFLGRPTDNPTNYDDSAIVIQLPANITPGTFCMTIWAYDASGYTSNVVDECVTIEQLGSSDGTSFAGHWKLSGFKLPPAIVLDSSYEVMDTAWHNNITDSTNVIDYLVSYYCVDGYLSQTQGSYYNPQNGQDIAGISSDQASIPEYVWYKNSNLTLAGNGAWTFGGETVSKTFDVDLFSTLVSCSNISNSSNYNRDDESYTSIGGWSYNAATNEFTIVEKDQDASGEETLVAKYYVIDHTATSFTLMSEQDDEASLKMIKQ